METDLHVYGDLENVANTPKTDLYGDAGRRKNPKGTTFAKPPQAAEKSQNTGAYGDFYKVCENDPSLTYMETDLYGDFGSQKN